MYELTNSLEQVVRLIGKEGSCCAVVERLYGSNVLFQRTAFILGTPEVVQ